MHENPPVSQQIAAALRGLAADGRPRERGRAPVLLPGQRHTTFLARGAVQLSESPPAPTQPARARFHLQADAWEQQTAGCDCHRCSSSGR